MSSIIKTQVANLPYPLRLVLNYKGKSVLSTIFESLPHTSQHVGQSPFWRVVVLETHHLAMLECFLCHATGHLQGAPV